ncbi:MAG: SemiSWEET family sugar transporter [Muribaculaceae bacterium]
MDTAYWTSIFGWAASISMILGYMPQAIVTIRTRDTDGIAMPTFVMMGLGSLFFVIQGILIGNWPLVVTNVITTICSVIIVSIKVRNDFKKKKGGKR